LKKLYLQILISLFFLTISSFAQTKWYANSRATFSDNPNSICFKSENEGWVCGNNGMIAHTTDGSNKWEIQNSKTTNALRDVYFLNSSVGWIGGDGRTLLKTTDGGKNWSAVTVSALTDSKQNIYKVKFLDNNIGFLIASTSNSSSTASAYVLKTTDGGATWTTTLTTTKSILAWSFASSSNGIVTGKDTSIIYYTTNGGSEWKKSSSPTDMPQGINYTRSELYGCYMVNNNIAYATGWGSDAAGLQPTIYLKSTDGGKTWKYILQQEVNRSYFNNQDMYFKDENTGIAVGGNSSTLGGRIYKTTDGGINWIAMPNIATLQFNEISVVGNVVYLLATNGSIFKTTDMGSTLTWSMISNSTLSTISFPSSNTGYAGSSNNPSFLKTTDGGYSWKTKFLWFPTTSRGWTTYYIAQFFFPNENTGYSTHRNGMIAKTTDGGNSWNLIYDDGTSTHHFNSIYFIDDKTGWAVARWAGSSPNYNYGIVKITNGNTVTPQDTAKAGELKGIHFSDASNGVAVGLGGNIVYTTNGGTTWTKATSPVTVNLNDVKFVNSSVVVAVGDTTTTSGTIILSLDGGKTWTQPSTQVPKYGLNAIAIKQPTEAYISGYYKPTTTIRGTVLKLSLSGITVSMTDMTDTTLFENNLTAITADPSGQIWAVSVSNSLILSTKKTTKVNPFIETIEKYNLSQNYPNPFNPSTNIEWNMKNSGPVEIRVYDLLGKEVKTLVNELFQPGNHIISWDGRNRYDNLVSSGIYYYRIKVNDFIDVKKMMYLR
jgi:photosystem II stability/assembly factor-like uncharacterized protein